MNFNGALSFSNLTDQPATVICNVVDAATSFTVDGIAMFTTIPAGTHENVALAAGEDYPSAGTFEAAIRCQSNVEGVIHGGSTLNMVAAG